MPDEPITIRGGSLTVIKDDKEVYRHPSENGKIKSVDMLQGDALLATVNLNDPGVEIVIHYDVPSANQQAQ